MKTDFSNSSPWRLYWGTGPLPDGARVIGTVTRKPSDVGALLVMPTGALVQGNAGVLRPLPPAVLAAVTALCGPTAQAEPGEE